MGEAGVALPGALRQARPVRPRERPASSRASCWRCADRRRRSSRPPTSRPSASSTRPRAAGLTVPGDLSVIGFDDIELAAAIGLTTVRQPLRESGRLGRPSAAARARRRENVYFGRGAGGAAGPRGRGAPDGFATSVVIRHIRLDTRRRGASLEPVPLFRRSAAESDRRPWRRGPGHAYHHPPHPIRRGYGRRRPAAPIRLLRRPRRARGARRADAADHAKAGAPLSPHGLRRGPRAGRGIGPDQGARALRSRLRHRLPALRRADHDRRDAPLAARPHVGRAPAARGGRDVARAAVGHRAPERDARPRADAPRTSPSTSTCRSSASSPPRRRAAGAGRCRSTPRPTLTPRTAPSATSSGRRTRGCAAPSTARGSTSSRPCSSRSSATSCACTSPATCPSARSPGGWACRR